jgi:hypothetical protein
MQTRLFEQEMWLQNEASEYAKRIVSANNSLATNKTRQLLDTAEFQPRDRVRVKSVEGSMIETHGSLQTQVL